MSKLATSVVAHDTRERRAGLSPRLCIVSDSFMPISDCVRDGTVYRIGLSLYMRAVISEGVEIAPAVTAARRSLVEEVFGEFRPYFCQIEEAIWDQNMPEVKRLLAEFRDQMFNVDSDMR